MPLALHHRLGAAAFLLSLAPLVSPIGVVDNVLVRWRDLAAKCERPYSYSGEDGALLAVAMYDAINAIARKYTPFGAPIGAPAGSATDAAAAQAAHDVLVRTCPEQRALYDDALARELAGVNDATARANGVGVGRRAAEGVLGARGGSGVGRPDSLPAPPAPGAYAQTAEFVGTSWASARPWAMERPDQFRAPPPPALTSAEWARDLEEIRRLGGAASTARTAEQTEIGRYWGMTGVRVVLRQLIGRPGRSLVDDARLLALAEVAWADAYVSLFEGKYHYRFWRPVTAIRYAAMDGNAATQPDPTWMPMLETPPHPEYPCGHCVSAAAVGAVIDAEFGARMPSIVIDRPGAPVHRFDTAQEYVDVVSISRLYAGAHPRFSVDAGKASGASIGRLVVQRFFRPLAAAPD